MTDDQDTQQTGDGDTTRFDEDMILATNAERGSSNRHVEAVAREIGPRPPGSDQETEAADYVVNALRDVGLPAARLSASAPRYDTLPEIVLAGAALVAVAAAALFPAVGLILLVIVLAAIVASFTGHLKLASLSSGTDTVNVLSIVPPAETEVRRLILTATLDTGKVGILSRRHLNHLYVWLHAVAPAATGLALALALLALVDASSVFRVLLVLPGAALVAALALLVERQQNTVFSPGAISNASGIATLVEVARSTVTAPPRWLEVWFLAVGGSTLRGGGMLDFLGKNTFDPDTTYFVHLQGPGGGYPTVPKVTGAGFRGAPATPLLTWIFDSVRSDASDPNTPQAPRLQVESLATATHRAGYQSVVLTGIDTTGHIPFVNHSEDLPYQVNDESIEESARLVALAIDALDREVASRAMLARSSASIQDAPAVSGTQEGLPTRPE